MIEGYVKINYWGAQEPARLGHVRKKNLISVIPPY